MDGISKIQELLDSDAGFRKRFVEDPVSTLTSSGFRLSKGERDALRRFARQAKSSPKTSSHLRRLPSNSGNG